MKNNLYICLLLLFIKPHYCSSWSLLMTSLQSLQKLMKLSIIIYLMMKSSTKSIRLISNIIFFNAKTRTVSLQFEFGASRRQMQLSPNSILISAVLSFTTKIDNHLPYDFWNIIIMSLLLTIMISHLLKFNQTSSCNSIIISAICKSIESSKLFLMKLKIMRQIALLNFLHICSIWLILIIKLLIDYHMMRIQMSLKLWSLHHLLQEMSVKEYILLWCWILVIQSQSIQWCLWLLWK